MAGSRAREGVLTAFKVIITGHGGRKIAGDRENVLWKMCALLMSHLHLSHKLLATWRYIDEKSIKNSGSRLQSIDSFYAVVYGILDRQKRCILRYTTISYEVMTETVLEDVARLHFKNLRFYIADYAFTCRSFVFPISLYNDEKDQMITRSSLLHSLCKVRCDWVVIRFQRPEFFEKEAIVSF